MKIEIGSSLLPVIYMTCNIPDSYIVHPISLSCRVLTALVLGE